MFKWQFAAVVAAGLALVSSGSAVAGMQDQTTPVSKKQPAVKKQSQPQQTVSTRQQNAGLTGQPAVKGQAKPQKQSQEQAKAKPSQKPSQPAGKGKIVAGLKRKPNQPQAQPQPGAQPQSLSQPQ